MIVYRLSRRKYKDDLSGKGAEMAGGRWNSKGVPMLYTAASISLCTVEVAVHLPLGIEPADYYLIKIEVPDNIEIKEVALADLPSDWRSFPHPNSTQEIGDNFIREGKYAIMKLPSAAIPGEFNYILNPAHAAYKQVRIIETTPYRFDPRLFIR